MYGGFTGEVVNYKYWQTLQPVETSLKDSIPTKEAIEFEKHLQKLEQENQLYEMGLAMKRASRQTNKDLVCSVDALKCDSRHKRQQLQKKDSHWYLTKDAVVDDENDVKNDRLLAVLEREPEYKPLIQKIVPAKS